MATFPAASLEPRAEITRDLGNTHFSLLSNTNTDRSGRDTSRLCSHWSTSYITGLSLVDSLIVILRPLSYAIKGLSDELPLFWGVSDIRVASMQGMERN